MLLGESRLVGALQKTARASPADLTLLAAQRVAQTTLRFAGGRIHQNFHEEDLTVWVKVACGARMGVATTSSLKPSALAQAIQSAMAIARLSAKQVAPAFSATPPKPPTPQVKTCFPQTIHHPLAEVVRLIRDLRDRSQKNRMGLAGSFVIGESELAVVGSGGLVQYQPFTVGGMRLVATQGASSGFAAQAFRNLDDLDPEALIRRAWDLCRRNRNPQPIPLGRYDVLLEPEAVAELVEWLSAIGFGAKQLMERTGFMTGRIGERIFGRQITVGDDGSDPRGLAIPFDFEGIPKKRVALIERGVAKGIVYDSAYGKLYRHPSTGHAPAYNDFEGPIAQNLIVAGGQIPAEDLLKKMDRGLWVSRFHYVNGLLNTKEALMTGLTRDGTFRVRNGRPAGAVKNLRFTESILEAFSRVAAVSREQRRVADPSQDFSSVVAPAILLRDFHFTGQTR